MKRKKIKISNSKLITILCCTLATLLIAGIFIISHFYKPQEEIQQPTTATTDEVFTSTSSTIDETEPITQTATTTETLPIETTESEPESETEMPLEPEEYDEQELLDQNPTNISSNNRTKNLGIFTLTAYCHCYSCNGEWAYGPTATGVMPQAGRTIAVDPNVIPYGTEVIINGNTYIAEDCGGAIQGNRIDIFFDSHSECMNFGVQTAEVEIVI